MTPISCFFSQIKNKSTAVKAWKCRFCDSCRERRKRGRLLVPTHTDLDIG